MGCTMCPRRCGADREKGERGYCGAGSGIRVAKVMLHPWEEPCLISGPGAGAIFFGGCPLKCVYCQNKAISHGDVGEIWDRARLEKEILHLQEEGASCIDLVSPTQYAEDILCALGAVKDRIKIPVVWNTGGYETVDTVRACRGLVDVFLTDFKYGTAETAEKYSAAPDYVAVAKEALTASTHTMPSAKITPNVLISQRLRKLLVSFMDTLLPWFQGIRHPTCSQDPK